MTSGSLLIRRSSSITDSLHQPACIQNWDSPAWPHRSVLQPLANWPLGQSVNHHGHNVTILSPSVGSGQSAYISPQSPA